eukprot:TRINITY_DN32722_c0_g1_i1.p1 TRINITY_DN32722_c0_g1~~TRINITY_DN32722_c0_g1_i1.p1  ORF type:complete len:1185 (-),score=190.08 TRINITY_DN32722_c0_g1_i1:673-4101(-)
MILRWLCCFVCVVATFCAIPGRHLLAEFDFSESGISTTELNGSASVLKRIGLQSARASWLNTSFAANFPATVPNASTDSFELTILTIPSGIADIYVDFWAISGFDGPSNLTISSSLDDPPVVATWDLTAYPDGRLISTHIPIHDTRNSSDGSILLSRFPDNLTLRITAGSAARVAGTMDSYMALYGTLQVAAAPAGCPSAFCLHQDDNFTAEGVPATGYPFALPSVVDHSPFGRWDCRQLRMNASADTQTVACLCDCYIPPIIPNATIPPLPPYDPCNVTSVSHPRDGTVCVGTSTVNSSAVVAGLAACDTLDGDLVITSPADVALPRLTRVTGRVEVPVNASTTSLSMPVLRYAGAVVVDAPLLSALAMPQLRDVCGGELVFRGTSLPEIHLPDLGGSAAVVDVSGHTNLSMVDLGSAAGGPAWLTGAAEADAYVLRLAGTEVVPLAVSGLSALTAVQNGDASGRPNRVHLEHLVGAAWPSSFENVALSNGTAGAVSLTVQNNKVAAPLRLLNATDLVYLVVDNNVGMTRLDLPKLGGADALHMQQIVVRGESVVAADLGSEGGGPVTLTGADANSSVPSVLHLEATSPGYLNVTGLTKLTVVQSTANARNDVRLTRLAHAWPASLIGTRFGITPNEVRLYVTGNSVPGTLDLAGLLDVGYIRVENNTQMTHFVSSMLGQNLELKTQGLPTLERLVVQGNPQMTAVVLGYSALVGNSSWGPRNITGKRGFGTPCIAIVGSNAMSPMRVSGVDSLMELASWPDEENEILVANITAFIPWNVVIIPSGSRRPFLTIVGNILPLLTPVVFSAAKGLVGVHIEGNVNASRAVFPYLESNLTTVTVHDNVGMMELQIGHFASGNISVVGGNVASPVISLRASHPHFVVQWNNLHGLYSGEGRADAVSIGNYVDPSFLADVEFGTGARAVSLRITNSQATDLRLAATDLAALEVTENPNLTELALRDLGTAGPCVMQSLEIINNPLLVTTDLGRGCNITGRNVASASALHLDGPVLDVAEMPDMTSIQSSSGVCNTVWIGRVGPAAASLAAAEYGVNVSAVRLVVRNSDISSLNFTAARQFCSMEIAGNADLTFLGFPGWPVGEHAVLGDAAVLDNPNLPVGCTNISSYVRGNLTQSGNDDTVNTCP